MPDFFEDKQYNDYFEKLNNRIGETSEKKPIPQKTVKRKKGYYKVIRLKRTTSP